MLDEYEKEKLYDKVIDAEEEKLGKLSRYVESDLSDSASQVSKADDLNLRA